MPYFLHHVLQSNEVQRDYDRVIIDAPPRMSAAALQAFCAATHLAIPTIMDRLSTEAVSSFVSEIENLRRGGRCPHLRHIGVIGNMLPGGQATWHRPAVQELKDALRYSDANVELLDESTWIRDLPALGRAAGETIAVLQGERADQKNAREAFISIVEHIKRVAPRRSK